MAADLTELARTALLEVTPESSVGAPVGTVDEGDGVVSVLFANRMPGYPGWRWTVSIAQLEGDEPSVLEVELMPGDGSLLAPEWVPWSERLAEYRAEKEAEAEGSADHDDDESDDDDDDESDDDFDADEDDEDEDEGDSDDDEYDDEDEDDLDESDDDEIDGVDVDELDDVDDEDDDTDADDESDEDDDQEPGGSR